MKLRSIAVAAALFAAFSAHAALDVYTDRAAFLAALSSHTTDALDDIGDGPLSGLDRGAYAWTMSSYGCNSGPSQCGSNEDDGMFYPAYVWTYGSGTFVFDAPINAFGLSFGNYNASLASVELAGATHSVPSGGGFLGIVDTSGTFTSVSYSASGSGSLFDNVVYGATAPVPEPDALALMLIGVAGLGFATRRR